MLKSRADGAMRVLLGQLDANGDCLYATILARQLKHDFPDCELTWAISNKCRHLLDLNTDVDEIWEIDTNDRERTWWAFEEAVLRTQAGPKPFDRVVLSQIWPGNFRNYDGTIRPSILRAYDKPITVPIDSVINVSEDESNAVDLFVRENGIDRYDHRILFEFSHGSAQSYLTSDFAIQVARVVGKQLKDCCFILSSHEPLNCEDENVFSAHGLGMRQNAALTHHCSLFVGCGSGLTVVATSGAAKELPNIQLLRAHTSVFASFFHDFEYFGKPTDRFIEMGDAPVEQVAAAVVSCCRDGLPEARGLFHRPLTVTFDFYFEFIEACLLRKAKYFDALTSVANTLARYGPNETLLNFARDRVIPKIHGDKMNVDPRTRQSIDAIMEEHFR
jgi:hypothetical protein